MRPARLCGLFYWRPNSVFNVRSMMSDPENTLLQRIVESDQQWIGYAWLVLLAMWGGTANYISRMKKARRPFSLFELIGEWVVSGFCGLITAYLCMHLGWDFKFTAAAAGIAGHMGGRGLGFIEHWIIHRKFGNLE